MQDEDGVFFLKKSIGEWRRRKSQQSAHQGRMQARGPWRHGEEPGEAEGSQGFTWDVTTSSCHAGDGGMLLKRQAVFMCAVVRNVAC